MRSYQILFFLNFLSTAIAGETYRYDFRWLNLPVSEFIIKTNLESKKYDNTNKFTFSTRSLGPLKLIRNYSSKVEIIDNSDGWEYNLTGIDRGKSEEKKISYLHDKIPIISYFKDDDDVSPIVPNNESDKNSIDPFSVLLNTISMVRKKNSCNAMYKVFDGKRSYKVRVLNSESSLLKVKQQLHDKEIFKCKLSIQSMSKKQDKKFLSEKNRWPFNREGRSIYIWFSKNNNYYPVRFEIDTPIGLIKGNLKNNET